MGGVFTEAAKRSGKYPQSTDTEVNNCFSMYLNSVIIEQKNGDFQLIYCCQRLQFWRTMTERPRSSLFLSDK